MHLSVRLMPFLATLAACSRAIAPLDSPGSSTVALTSGPNTSMIYLARTSAGVLAIDLGWWGHDRALSAALGKLGAAPDDVRFVFLTHSHRDHIGAWEAVKKARFHVAAPERSRLLGDSSHDGWIPKLADRVKPPALPRATDIEIVSFAGDTEFVLGTDTLRAYLVSGHTAGTAVYLFRGVLFLGDAVTWSRLGGFSPAKRGFSDDRPQAVANLADLWPRLPPDAVHYACTAHARCAPYDSRFLEDVAR
jgi:hydroxyacylglutathione hydrolase